MSTNILDIKKYWEKPTAVILGVILLLPLFFVTKEFIPSTCSVWWRVLIVVCIELLFICIWLIATNRLPMPSSKYVISLFVNFDDDKAEEELKKMIKQGVDSINKRYRFIKVRRHPYNYFSDKEDLLRYFKRTYCQSDIVLMLKAKSGYQTIQGEKQYKIEVSERHFVGKFDVDVPLEFYRTQVSIKRDFSIRNLHKNWEYIDNNSFNDRQKMSYNLNDTISYSCGIYLLFYREFDYALRILKDLYEPTYNTLHPPILNKNVLKIDAKHLANARLGEILVNLFYVIAYKEQVLNKNSSQAYNLLVECEELFPDAPDKLNRNIMLARCAYECGNLDKSKEFTTTIATIPGGAFFSYLNHGFYAIIENNISALAYNYSKVCNYVNTADFDILDVIEFLENHKSKIGFENKVQLLDFAAAMITKLFVNDDEGNRLIDDFSTHNMDNQDLQPLLELCSKYRNKVLNRRLLEEKKRIVNRSNKKKKRRR